MGAVACAFLAGPWARDSADWNQYLIAAALIGVGVVLWFVTWLSRRGRPAAAPVGTE